MGLNSLKATESLRGDSLLFTPSKALDISRVTARVVPDLLKTLVILAILCRPEAILELGKGHISRGDQQVFTIYKTLLKED